MRKKINKGKIILYREIEREYQQLRQSLKKAMRNNFFYDAIIIEIKIIDNRNNLLCQLFDVKFHGQRRYYSEYEKMCFTKENTFINDCCFTRKASKELLVEITNWMSRKEKTSLCFLNSNKAKVNVKSYADDGFVIVKKYSALVNRVIKKHATIEYSLAVDDVKYDENTLKLKDVVENTMCALEKKYPHGSRCKSISQLIKDNPELSFNLSVIEYYQYELFRRKLEEYLFIKGIIE